MNRSTGRSKGERLVLGIETSCDETAAAVVARSDERRGRILSNIVRSQLDEHRPFGGVVPEIAARAHAECLDDIVTQALADAGVSLADLDAVAATAGPGLNSGLVVGVVTAKALALAAAKPFIAVNHLEAHALSVGLTEGLPPPYLVLLVSGGHTQLLLVRGIGQYERIGTTIDDALGEAFDKTAKLLGLGFPGGPAVEQAAKAGDEKRFAFPRPMMGREEAHFSFAGLKTAVRHQAQALVPLTAKDVADLSASFQAAACDSVIDRVKRAIEICRLGRSADAPANAGDPTLLPANVGSPPLRSDRPNLRLVVAGGVAANMRLKTALQKLADETSTTLHIPPPALCTDNAAMIAWAGAERLALGLTDPLDAPVRPRWPLDAGAPPAIGAGVKA